MKFESGLEWFPYPQCAMARKANKLVVLELIDDHGGRRGCWNETCHLSVKSLDDLYLATNSWK